MANNNIIMLIELIPARGLISRRHDLFPRFVLSIHYYLNVTSQHFRLYILVFFLLFNEILAINYYISTIIYSMIDRTTNSQMKMAAKCENVWFYVHLDTSQRLRVRINTCQ